ncbi:hypothetical protein NKJ66_23385 [Mesorhizobium sp. M0078]|uniref:hypothetical protein n=1 Tax=Mesorhizobium sp. M0078 TaxID=2956871 RepID=UPI00333B719C
MPRRLERLHDGIAHITGIDRIKVGIGGDQRPKKIAEGNVYRRAIIQRTGADHEEHVGGLGGALGKQQCERTRQIIGIGASSADSENLEQIGGTTDVGGEECIEHGSDKDCPASMRLGDAAYTIRVRFLVQRASQAAAAARDLAELTGKLYERIVRRNLGADIGVRRRAFCVGCQARGVEAAAGPLQRIEKRILMREVAKQRRKISKRFVKRGDIDVGRLGEMLSDAVDDGVGHLMRDDIVRQAGENGLPRQHIAVGIRTGGKVSEHDSVDIPVIIGVRLKHRVGVEIQTVWARACPMPVDLASKRDLEAFERLRRNGIHHLLVESRVGLARVEPTPHQNRFVVEIDRRIIRPGVTIIVYDRNSCADRPGLKRLIGDRQAQMVAQHVPHARIECIDLQRAPRWERNWVGWRAVRHRLDPSLSRDMQSSAAASADFRLPRHYNALIAASTGTGILPLSV